MKRHPSLEPFSRDHNDGLIQARRLEVDGAAALPAFRDSWNREMKDHFEEEERLLPPLCASESAERLRSEHRQIESLAASAAGDEDARRLATILHDHIRWEERELFIEVERAHEASLRSLASQTAGIERKRDDARRRELVARRPTGPAVPPLADLTYLARTARGSGPEWGMETEDLNATLLVWQAGEGVSEHVNEELDVMIVGVEGEGEVTVDGHVFVLSPGQTVVVPKGAVRSVCARSARFAHLNVHRRRRKLTLGPLPPRRSTPVDNNHGQP
ncbi:hypothetical protein BH11ARM2_BH11ARM2_17910 [soil metagenome]